MFGESGGLVPIVLDVTPLRFTTKPPEGVAFHMGRGSFLLDEFGRFRRSGWDVPSFVSTVPRTVSP